VLRKDLDGVPDLPDEPNVPDVPDDGDDDDSADLDDIELAEEELRRLSGFPFGVTVNSEAYYTPLYKAVYAAEKEMWQYRLYLDGVRGNGKPVVLEQLAVKRAMKFSVIVRQLADAGWGLTVYARVDEPKKVSSSFLFNLNTRLC
jgi:hypothetical protein